MIKVALWVLILESMNLVINVALSAMLWEYLRMLPGCYENKIEAMNHDDSSMLIGYG